MSTRKEQLLRRAAGKKGRNVALTKEEKALRDALNNMGGDFVDKDYVDNAIAKAIAGAMEASY